jgi:hypothetical protein
MDQDVDQVSVEMAVLELDLEEAWNQEEVGNEDDRKGDRGQKDHASGELRPGPSR